MSTTADFTGEQQQPADTQVEDKQDVNSQHDEHTPDNDDPNRTDCAPPQCGN